jgi:2',3'-cyclic-nucleotide 2'-phosphodiesterase (5'-nucleotidase family)
MVKLKKYPLQIKLFVLLLTFATLIGCKSTPYQVYKIETSKTEITSNLNLDEKIEKYIQPFKEHIDSDLSTILAYCPENLEKNKGKWQTNIGSYIADVTLAASSKIFEKREGKKVDICLLNHGGIRSIIPKGPITARNAYEVMPFENSAFVLALKGTTIAKLAQYIIDEKKPQPLAGMSFVIDKNNNPTTIMVQDNPLQLETTYYVVTSDYLSNGGDNMNFFKEKSAIFDLNYKLRNIIIDDFKASDTLKISSKQRITDLN